MKDVIRKVPSNLLAMSLIDKLKKRKAQIENTQLRNLNPALVKEWKRLKLLERVVLG